MNDKTLKEFFNNNFFLKGEPKEIQIAITFKTVNGQVCEIPGMKIWESTTIGEIFHTFHDYLKEKGPIDQVDQVEPITDEVRTVEYRDNQYMVLYQSDGTTKIRKSNGEFLNQESPTGKAILKKSNTPKE